MLHDKTLAIATLALRDCRVRRSIKPKQVFTEAQIKGSARATKRKEAQRENELAARSLNDDDKWSERKLKQK